MTDQNKSKTRNTISTINVLTNNAGAITKISNKIFNAIDLFFLKSRKILRTNETLFSL